MKAASFDYLRPASVREACEALSSHEDARLIAGGQTLVPMMAMRLARPSLLIDIARIQELQFIEFAGETLKMGACTRQVEAERSDIVLKYLPLLARALPFVGHAPTRNRGTLGGSVANADPAAEIPLVLVTLGGFVRFQSADHSGTIAAAEFFEGPMMTSLNQESCLTGLDFPVWAEGRLGTGFCEVSARQTDFAYVSAAAQVALDPEGRIMRCAVGVGGALPVPTFMAGVAAALKGEMPSQQRIRGVARAAVEDLEIMVDSHASSDYRRRVAALFIEQAILQACKDAQTVSGLAA